MGCENVLFIHSLMIYSLMFEFMVGLEYNKNVIEGV